MDDDHETIDELLDEILEDMENEEPEGDEVDKVIHEILYNVELPEEETIVRGVLSDIIREVTGDDDEKSKDEFIAELLDNILPDENKELCRDILKDIVDTAEEIAEEGRSEEEQKEEEKEKPFDPKRHHLLILYGIPERESPFELTFNFMETVLERLTDDHYELNLSGNDLVLRVGRRLVDADMDAMCSFLKKNSQVISVNLAYNKITQTGLKEITEFMEYFDSVVQLNLMCNNLHGSSMEELAKLGYDLPLECLRVNGNNLGFKLLTSDCSLTYLDVGQTSQRLSSLVLFTAALHTNDRLLLLDMSRPLGEAMIGFDSGHWADTVGEAMRLNSTLAELYLQKSGFSCHDVERLMLGLQHNRTLKLLDLTANNVGDLGAARLAEYLSSRPGLLALLLGRNNLSDHGARSLATALPRSRLQLLDVSYNRLRDTGVTALLHTLKKPTLLRALYVWGNTITHHTCQAPLERLQTLRRMLMSGALTEGGLDVRVYRVDGVDHVAFLASDRSHPLHYCVPPLGFPGPRRRLQPRRQPLPASARVCPRRPTDQRPQPLAGRCPDADAHARLPGVDPRFCH